MITLTFLKTFEYGGTYRETMRCSRSTLDRYKRLEAEGAVLGGTFGPAYPVSEVAVAG